MNNVEINDKRIKDNLTHLKYGLLSSFPNLDLRLGMIEGSKVLRCSADSFSDAFIELDLSVTRVDELLRSAIFEIKVLARMFDA